VYYSVLLWRYQCESRIWIAYLCVFICAFCTRWPACIIYACALCFRPTVITLLLNLCGR